MNKPEPLWKHHVAPVKRSEQQEANQPEVA